ncbi:PilN domain-containing protein [Rheinheimera baltica]|uniref:PilN domain-containing protein n=1 Tax=Rheinheimera baltica TaxID=67576 RepID=A0ABT9HUY4_9GAMM|nr:PilN domain-containing protein [Rheinheimera baltica]MDP5134932.1 PilN domain-containing protein [Rheinheimera baltica]MDP5149817.1 PilN domain-containing protein [Rheinheimera baltica]
MKYPNAMFPRFTWIDVNTKALGTGRAFVVPRQLYDEHHKRYKVSVTELWRLIANEKKVLSRSGNKVIWQVNKPNADTFSVSYAVITASFVEQLPSGFCLAMPETWLLPSILQADKLYCIEGESPYWAIMFNQQLHSSPVKGLMTQARFFKEAIGFYSADDEHIAVNIQQYLQRHTPQNELSQLVGLVVRKTAVKKQRTVPWKKLAVASFGICSSYAVLLSAFLFFSESQLNNKAERLQLEAKQVFQLQDKQAVKANTLQAYKDTFDKYPSINTILNQLKLDLPAEAELQRIQVVGRQVEITGSAASATDILATLSEKPYWSDVRFIQDVRKRESGEEFVLSLVFSIEKSDINVD